MNLLRFRPLNSKRSGWGRTDAGCFDLGRDPDGAVQLEDDLPFWPVGTKAGRSLGETLSSRPAGKFVPHFSWVRRRTKKSAADGAGVDAIHGFRGIP